jgi:hypothetical protein
MAKDKKYSLDARVRAIGESGKAKGMPNWFNLPQNKELRLLHINVCKKLVEISNANGNYPITYLVYFAVSKNAHRIPTFLGGYTTFNEKKAKKIFAWLKLFAKHNKNEKLFRNPNLADALCRFYDKYSTKTEDFKAALEKYEPNPKVTNFTMVAEGLGIAKQPKVDVTELEAALEPTEVEVAAE